MNKFNYYFTILSFIVVIACTTYDLFHHRWGMLPTDIIFAVIFGGIALLVRKQIKAEKEEKSF